VLADALEFRPGPGGAAAPRRSARRAAPLANFETSPAGANRSVRELLDRPYGGEQVRGYLGHVVVGDLQDAEAATPGHERVANRPVLALGEERGRVDRLTCGELEQITALAADGRSLCASDPSRTPRSDVEITLAGNWPREMHPAFDCFSKDGGRVLHVEQSVRARVGEEFDPGPPAEADVPLTAAHVREARP
jgi:hypothetical protein